MSEVDPEIKAQKDAESLAKVAAARRVSIGERIAAGPRMFDENCRIMKDEIRTEFPDSSDSQVEEEFRKRLAEEKKVSDGDLYVDAGWIDE